MTGRPIALLLGLVTIVAACGDGGGNDAVATSETSPDTTGAASTGSTSAGPASPTDGGTGAGTAVPAAFDFVLDDVRGGAPVEGASFAGTDVVVWFWAPWCTLCNREAPDVAAVAAARDDVRFLGMAGLDSEDAAADFVDRHGLEGFPHAFDEDGDTWEAFGITSQSSFAFVDDDGSIEITNYGLLGREEIESRIDALVEG